MVTRAPGRFRSQATALHRRGVVTTYKLHDRFLSNRRARSLYESHRPSLDGPQRRIVDELDREGYALADVRELVAEDAWQRMSEYAANFVRETEDGLAREERGEGGDLRRRAGKDFLVREYDVGECVALAVELVADAPLRAVERGSM